MPSKPERTSELRTVRWKKRFVTGSDSLNPAMKRLVDDPAQLVPNAMQVAAESLMQFEATVRGILNTIGVSTMLYGAYLNYGRELWKLSQRVNGESLTTALWVLGEKWVARGLQASTLQAIAVQSGVSLIPTVPGLLLPADHAIDIPLTQLLTWSASSRVNTYTVYFGTANPPPSAQTGVTTLSYDPTLINSTHYFWRIRAINSFGYAESAVRDFTTVAP